MLKLNKNFYLFRVEVCSEFVQSVHPVNPSVFDRIRIDPVCVTGLTGWINGFPINRINRREVQSKNFNK